MTVISLNIDSREPFLRRKLHEHGIPDYIRERIIAGLYSEPQWQGVPAGIILASTLNAVKQLEDKGEL